MFTMSQTAGSVDGGLLIIFEGIDGTGKTTQLELARDKLSAEGWPVQVSRNLGGTPIGEKLREIIKSPLSRPEMTNLYVSAAIQEALVETIASERQRGKVILMDRGPTSLAAYEIYGGGLRPDLVWPYVDDGMARLKPELAIIYDVDVPAALGRIKPKSGDKADYFESQSPDYFKRVAAGYAAAAKRYGSCLTIDGGQPIEAVHQQTMQAIRRTLASHAHSTH